MSQTAELEEIVYKSLPAQGSFRIPISHVLPGMFIADLDRPWTDTPFPGGGFIVAGDAQIEALRAYCRSVWVDPDYSNASLSRTIRAAAVLMPDPIPEPSLNGTMAFIEGSRRGNRPPPPGADAQSSYLSSSAYSAGEHGSAPALRSDVRVSVAARARFRHRITAGLSASATPATAPKSALARMGGWLSGGKATARDRNRLVRSLPVQALVQRYGAAIGATSYPDRLPLRHALLMTRSSHAKAGRLMNGVLADMRAGRALALARLSEAAAELTERAIDNPEALIWLSRVREEDVNGAVPAVTVASLMLLFGRHLGLSRDVLVELAMIGLLADIGKAQLPRELIDYPGMLAPKEFEFVKDHVRIGLDKLAGSSEVSSVVLSGIAQHHERLDGSGYPHGLQGGAIGLYGRMAAIVDCYAALVSARPYANSVAPETALAGLHGWGGTLFCAQLVEEFTFALGIFPIGGLVQLETGEVAAVIDHDPTTGLQPKLLVLTGPDKGPLRPVKDRDGERSPDDIYNGAPVRIAMGLPVGAFGLKLRDFYRNLSG